MDAEDALAALHVGAVDDDAAVETARAQQRRVEHIGPVRGRDEDDALVRLEAVHLDEQLVQRLLALVVPAAEARAAVAADRVDFVDEDDAGRILLALLEQVADAPTPTNISTKSETADREERDVGLTRPPRAPAGSCRFREGSISRTPLGMRPPSFELLRFLEELDDFLEFFLRLSTPATSLNVTFFCELDDSFALLLPNERALVAAALHLAHEEDPEADRDEERRPVVEQRRPRTGRRFLRLHGNAAIRSGLVRQTLAFRGA
ncbi:MAG: hypothetical protein U0Q55_23550 [Vicinamibacterales bacterium]